MRILLAIFSGRFNSSVTALRTCALAVGTLLAAWTGNALLTLFGTLFYTVTANNGLALARGIANLSSRTVNISFALLSGLNNVVSATDTLTGARGTDLAGWTIAIYFARLQAFFGPVSTNRVFAITGRADLIRSAIWIFFAFFLNFDDFIAAKRGFTFAT
jgi:hypothetical protein